MQTTIDSFLNSIMNINVLRMGGAAAGILGSGGDDGLAVQEAKDAAIALAGEYRKPNRSPEELERLTQNVEGHIRVLELTKVLSSAEADNLVEQLHRLR